MQKIITLVKSFWEKSKHMERVEEREEETERRRVRGGERERDK